MSLKGAARSGGFSRKEHPPKEFSYSIAQMPKRPDSYRMITFGDIADESEHDNNRRRQETSLNGSTGKHKSWEKHAWQNCHEPALLSENMYHLPPPVYPHPPSVFHPALTLPACPRYLFPRYTPYFSIEIPWRGSNNRRISWQNYPPDLRRDCSREILRNSEPLLPDSIVDLLVLVRGSA